MFFVFFYTLKAASFLFDHAYIILSALLYLILRKIKAFGLGKSLPLAFIGAVIAYVTFRSSNQHTYIYYLFFMLSIPLAFFIFALFFLNEKNTKTFVFLLGVSFLLITTTELVIYFQKSSYLHSFQKGPAQFCQLNETISPISPPKVRKITLRPCLSKTKQHIRYTQLINQEALAYYPHTCLGEQCFHPEKRNNRVWHSFFSQKNYIALTSSNLSPDALKEILSIEKPLFLL